MARNGKIRDMSAVSLEDRLAIEALVTEYAWLLDHREWERIETLFTPDCHLKIRGREIDGHQGLRQWASYRAAKQSRKTQHQMTLVRLVAGEDPDVVQGTASLVLHVAKSGGSDSYVDLVGEYRDEFVRGEDGWRFRRRLLVAIDEI